MKAKEKGKGFFAEFKKFIARGNVLDMAVGVIIGGSFGKIVTGLVNYIINPFVGIFVKGGSLDSLKTVITPEELNEAGEIVQKEVAILWGTWLQTIIDFLITALCIFLIIRVAGRVRDALEYKRIAAEAAAKREADEKAAAEAAAAEEAARALKEREDAFYANVAKQTELLESISKRLETQEK